MVATAVLAVAGLLAAAVADEEEGVLAAAVATEDEEVVTLMDN